MLKNKPKSIVGSKRLVNRISFLKHLFSKNYPKNTAENYNEMVTKFYSKIKKN
ncbi:MAG: hypothetical protein WC389_08340 [Lutibacter sp.]|jgi:hypothetical protein